MLWRNRFNRYILAFVEDKHIGDVQKMGKSETNFRRNLQRALEKVCCNCKSKTLQLENIAEITAEKVCHRKDVFVLSLMDF